MTTSWYEKKSVVTKSYRLTSLDVSTTNFDQTNKIISLVFFYK